jgi:uncharacterized glyoxalase superfamily protein PhnB
VGRPTLSPQIEIRRAADKCFSHPARETECHRVGPWSGRACDACPDSLSEKLEEKMAAKKKKGKASSKKVKAAPTKVRATSTALKIGEASPSFTVNDLDKSMAWYRDVVGFAIDERWEQEGKLMGVSLTAGKVTFMIGQDDWKKGRDRKKGEGFRLYCSTTQDVDAVARGIVARGGTLDYEPRDQSWGTREFSLTDPDGFKITIAKEKKKR